MKFKLKDIQPNPYRDLVNNPLLPEKVEELVESIRATGYWENIEARIREDGKPEVAYGHHRLEALRVVFGENATIELTVRKDMSDGNIVQKMVRENCETYGRNVQTIMESQRAAVKALSEGKISEKEMPIGNKANTSQLRYAPSFLSGGEPNKFGYTALSLATFLGMVKGTSTKKPQDRFFGCLGALELIEKGLLQERELVGVGTEHLYNIVNVLKEKEKENAAKAEELETKAAAATPLVAIKLRNKAKSTRQSLKQASTTLITKVKTKVIKTCNDIKGAGEKSLKIKPRKSKKLTMDEIALKFFNMLSFAVVKEAWKSQATIYHPDKGGDPETASDFNALWEQLKKSYGK
jgi:hypothetical protein